MPISIAPWEWKQYKEGIRFAFFRTYEQLCELAARLEVERAASPRPLTTAQRILSQYHLAYRDLQAVLLGVTDTLAVQAPAEGEWPVRQALAHIVQAERGFFTVCFLGLEHIHQGNAEAFEINEEIWNRFWADAPFTETSERSSLSEIQAYHASLHPRILQAFTTLTEDELGLPISYWESAPQPLEFRLHRFSSHLRQHTIQIEKTLDQLGQPPSEARRLLRIVFNALAAVEGAALGDESLGIERRNQIAVEIAGRTEEITKGGA
jgi:uncharacterized damage-inducible protein DinB